MQQFINDDTGSHEDLRAVATAYTGLPPANSGINVVTGLCIVLYTAFCVDFIYNFLMNGLDVRTAQYLSNIMLTPTLEYVGIYGLILFTPLIFIVGCAFILHTDAKAKINLAVATVILVTAAAILSAVFSSEIYGFLGVHDQGLHLGYNKIGMFIEGLKIPKIIVFSVVIIALWFAWDIYSTIRKQGQFHWALSTTSGTIQNATHLFTVKKKLLCAAASRMEIKLLKDRSKGGIRIKMLKDRDKVGIRTDIVTDIVTDNPSVKVVDIKTKGPFVKDDDYAYTDPIPAHKVENNQPIANIANKNLISESTAPIAIIGMYRDKEVCIDFNKHPHYLIPGTTGSGKTTLEMMMLFQLMEKYSPKELRIVGYCAKRGKTFARIEHLPHVLKIASDESEYVETTGWLIDEVDRRFGLLKEYADTENIMQLNKFYIDSGKPVLPSIIVIVDEASVLMTTIGALSTRLSTQLSLFREAGVYAVFFAQTPYAKVMPPALRANAHKIILRAPDANVAKTFGDSRALRLSREKREAIFGAGGEGIIFNLLNCDKAWFANSLKKIETSWGFDAKEKKPTTELLGIPANIPAVATKRSGIDKLFYLFQQGWNIQEVAEHFNVSTDKVSATKARFIKSVIDDESSNESIATKLRLSIKTVGFIKNNEGKTNTKSRVIALKQTGLSQVEIAKELGISQGTVSKHLSK